MAASQGGTQSIERSIRLVRALASRARFGWRLSDLARHCEIDKGTARRMLACLVRERLAERSATDQRYLPGPMLFELGLALPDYDRFKTSAYPLLERLAAKTNAVAFLCLRSGDELACAARIGEVPDNAFILNVGSRRALMNSAAGVAILIAMSEAEAAPIIENNQKVMMQQGCMNWASFERMLQRSRELGFGINEGNLVPGWNSYAVVVRNPAGSAFASVMVSGAGVHYPPESLPMVRDSLEQVARQLEAIAETVFGRVRRVEGEVPATVETWESRRREAADAAAAAAAAAAGAAGASKRTEATSTAAATPAPQDLPVARKPAIVNADT